MLTVSFKVLPVVFICNTIGYWNSNFIVSVDLQEEHKYHFTGKHKGTTIWFWRGEEQGKKSWTTYQNVYKKKIVKSKPCKTLTLRFVIAHFTAKRQGATLQEFFFF